MSAILGLFMNRSTWVIIVAVMVMAMLGFQHARITSLKSKVEERDRVIAIAKTELAQAQELIDRWRAAYEGLHDSVEEQNAKIAALEKEAKRRIAIARAAMAEAAQERASADRLAETIRQMELSTNECTALQQLIDTSRTGGVQ